MTVHSFARSKLPQQIMMNDVRLFSSVLVLGNSMCNSIGLLAILLICCSNFHSKPNVTPKSLINYNYLSFTLQI